MNNRCPICEEPPDDYGLVLIFVGKRHIYKGCMSCEITYGRLKEWEDDQREENS